MRAVIGWEVVCESKNRAWVNGHPVNCGHRHRTAEAMYACISKRLMAGGFNDAGMNVNSGELTLPIQVPKAKTVSQRLTVETVVQALRAASMDVPYYPLTDRPLADRINQKPNYRKSEPHTSGTTSIRSIVDAINEGVV